MPSWNCVCHANNDMRNSHCEDCGRPRPVVPGVTRDQDRTVCPFDGARLNPDGFCPTGNGYPITRLCPFVCDVCRARLTWDGTCLRCPRYAPGDRYEYDATNPHWRMVEKGPQRLLDPEENAQMARDFAALAGRLAARMTRKG